MAHPGNADTTSMRPPFRNLGTRVGAALLLYLLVTALLAGLALHTQLRQLGVQQQSTLGNALTTQLAETLKQPLINKNAVSIQVILDNLISETDLVARATAYSAANRLLAQSQDEPVPSGNLAAYTRPVSVDNTLVGMVRVELDNGYFADRFRLPLWTALGLWLATTVALGLWLIPTATRYSRRLRRAAEGLGTAADTDCGDLELLEESLKPFSAQGENAPQPRDDLALLAVEIPDLPRLRAQLNARHFGHLMERVDETIDTLLPLYRGERLPARRQVAFLQFGTQAGDHSLWQALYCAQALSDSCRSLSADERLPFRLRIALGPCRLPSDASPWRDDLQREDCLQQLMETLPVADDWEVLIAAGELNPEDLEGCELEPVGRGDLLRLRGFTGERRETFERQMQYLAQQQ